MSTKSTFVLKFEGSDEVCMLRTSSFNLQDCSGEIQGLHNAKLFVTSSPLLFSPHLPPFSIYPLSPLLTSQVTLSNYSLPFHPLSHSTFSIFPSALGPSTTTTCDHLLCLCTSDISHIVRWHRLCSLQYICTAIYFRPQST